MATERFANALRRFGGMWGSAWMGADMLTDVVRVTATIQRGRIEIPLVGQETVGYKPGRRSQEGSLAFQKVDTGWELAVYNSITMDVEELRAARDRGDYSQLGQFDLLLKHNDPHAFGKEVWKVTGCMLWQFDIGIDTTEDFIQREIPLTFEKAEPQKTFRVVNGTVQTVHSLGA
jgi:hypothetical protein